MAWPSTPLTSYVSNTVPAIKAFDLNAFQSGVTGIINATYSHKSTVIDGVGGAVVSPASGALVITQNAASKTFPNPILSSGTFYRDNIASAWAIVDNGGVLQKGVNVKGIAHVAASGIYTIEFNISLGGFTVYDLPASVTTIQSNAYANYQQIVATPTKIRVNTFDGPTGAAADFAFCLIVYGTT